MTPATPLSGVERPRLRASGLPLALAVVASLSGGGCPGAPVPPEGCLYPSVVEEQRVLRVSDGFEVPAELGNYNTVHHSDFIDLDLYLDTPILGLFGMELGLRIRRRNASGDDVPTPPGQSAPDCGQIVEHYARDGYGNWNLTTELPNLSPTERNGDVSYALQLKSERDEDSSVDGRLEIDSKDFDDQEEFILGVQPLFMALENPGCVAPGLRARIQSDIGRWLWDAQGEHQGFRFKAVQALISRQLGVDPFVGEGAERRLVRWDRVTRVDDGGTSRGVIVLDMEPRFRAEVGSDLFDTRGDLRPELYEGLREFLRSIRPVIAGKQLRERHHVFVDRARPDLPAQLALLPDSARVGELPEALWELMDGKATPVDPVWVAEGSLDRGRFEARSRPTLGGGPTTLLRLSQRIVLLELENKYAPLEDGSVHLDEVTNWVIGSDSAGEAPPSLVSGSKYRLAAEGLFGAGEH